MGDYNKQKIEDYDFKFNNSVKNILLFGMNSIKDKPALILDYLDKLNNAVDLSNDDNEKIKTVLIDTFRNLVSGSNQYIQGLDIFDKEFGLDDTYFKKGFPYHLSTEDRLN
jgi:hypothetical protein